MPIRYIPWLERPVISKVPAAMAMVTSTMTSLVGRTTCIAPAKMEEVPELHTPSSIPWRVSATMDITVSTVTSLVTRATQGMERNPNYHVQILKEQAQSEADYSERLRSQLRSGGIAVLVIGGIMVFLFLIACCCSNRRRRNRERYNVQRAVEVDGVMVEVPRPRADLARSASREEVEEVRREVEREYYARYERERAERALRREVARVAKEERSARKTAERGCPSLFERLRGHSRQLEVVRLADDSVEMQLVDGIRASSGSSIQAQNNSRNIPIHPGAVARIGRYRTLNAASSPPPEYRVYPRPVRVDSTARGAFPADRLRSSPSISLLELSRPASTPGPSRLATPPPMYSLHREDRIASLEQHQDDAHAAEEVADVEILPPYPTAEESYGSPPVSVPARQEPETNLEDAGAVWSEELVRRSMRIPPIIHFDSPPALNEMNWENVEESIVGPSGNRNIDRLNWHL